MASPLADETCLPCREGSPPLSAQDVAALVPALDPRWQVAEDGARLDCALRFRDFAAGVAFLNRLAAVAEAQDHHPDFCLRRYREVQVSLSTHAVGGLSRNDFVLAARIDALLAEPTP